MKNHTPVCPDCLSFENVKSLDIFITHGKGSRFCFRCEKHFQAVAAVPVEPVDLTAGMESF